MSKILKIIFLLAATTLLVDDYFRLILDNNTTCMSVNKNGDTDTKENEEKEDTKEENEEKEEKILTGYEYYKNYDFILKSTLYSKQYIDFLAYLNYKNRCRELESPPPEV